MTLEEIRQTAATIAPVVQECVARATAPLIARITTLESDVERERAAFAERLDAEVKRANVIEQIAAEQAKDSKRRVAELQALSADIETAKQSLHSARIDDIEARLAELDAAGDAAEVAAKNRAEAHADQMARTVDRYTEMLGEANARAAEYDKKLEDLRSGLQARIDDILQAAKAAETREAESYAPLKADIASLEIKVLGLEPLEERLAAHQVAEPIDYDRIVAEVRALIPAPENGKDVDPALLATMVADAVTMAMRALAPAKDGVGVAGAVIDRDHCLTLTLSDGSTRDLGVVVGKSVDMAEVTRLIQAEVAKIPVPKDGRDGFSLDDFDVEQKDGGRTVLLKFERGDTLHSFELSFPVVLDRGAFKDGDAYVAGDGVRWAGSWWIAQRDTKNKPGDSSEDWRMAVKCGRDGKSVDPAEVKTMVAGEVAQVEKRLAAKVDQMLNALANKAR